MTQKQSSKRGFKTASSGQSLPQQQPARSTIITSPQTPSWHLIAPSLQLFRRNIVTAVFITVLPPLLLQLGSALVGDGRSADRWTWVGVGLLGCFMVLLLANVTAPYLMQLRVVQGRQPSIWTIYRDSLRYIPRIVGFGLLFALMVAGGLLLFIIPGLIALRRYFLTPYFILDEDIGIREAMQHSAAASKLVRWHMWTMFAILLGFALLGFGLTRLSPTYGQFVSALLPAVYTFLPALRYREASAELRLVQAAKK